MTIFDGKILTNLGKSWRFWQALHPSFAIRPPLRLLSHSDTFGANWSLVPTGCFTKDGETSILQKRRSGKQRNHCGRLGRAVCRHCQDQFFQHGNSFLFRPQENDTPKCISFQALTSKVPILFSFL